MEMRKCKVCGEIKTVIIHFQMGKRNDCKECRTKYMKKKRYVGPLSSGTPWTSFKLGYRQ